jgi:glucoamylase
VKAWTVTDTGPYGAHRYFIRLSPTGEPNAAEFYDLNNGSLHHVDQRRVLDAGFLELTRLGELPASDPDISTSLRIVDSIIRRFTPSGPGWHRYGVQADGSTDGYGDCYEPDPTSCAPSGAPSYNGVGSGHLWPTLSGERAEQELQAGDRAGAVSLAVAMAHMGWGIGLAPEQAWEDPNIAPAPYGSNPASASIGFIDGQAPGSATPLIWAEGQYVRLLRDLQTGTLVDQPSITRERYVTAGSPAALPVSITAPGAGARQSSSTVISGTSAPGAQVVVSVAQPGAAADRATVLATAAPTGHFSATVAVAPGADLITVAASTGSHASGWAQETVTGS